MSGLRILRKIRKEFDYDDYVMEHYAVVKSTARGELRICCPHCADTKYKCYINNDKKLFNCYKCDFHTGNYDVFDFVAITEGIPRGKAMMRLAQEFAPTTPLTIEEIQQRALGLYEVEEDEPGETSSIKTIDSLPEFVYPLTSPSNLMEKPFWDYLMIVRGLTEKEVLDAKIHYVPLIQVPITNEVGNYIGNIGRRILFPVYGPGGSLISWQTRPIKENSGGQKYINCPNSEVNRTLWPFIPPHENWVVLVEGILDCIAIRRLGVPFSVYCTFGKKISHDQVKHLKVWGVNDVILFWDVDAKKAMLHAIEDLKMKFSVYVPDLSEWPKDYDPGKTMQVTDGLVCLEKALCNPIDVYSTDFVRWQMQ
jgi:DNA primase